MNLKPWLNHEMYSETLVWYSDDIEFGSPDSQKYSRQKIRNLPQHASNIFSISFGSIFPLRYNMPYPCFLLLVGDIHLRSDYPPEVMQWLWHISETKCNQINVILKIMEAFYETQ